MNSIILSINGYLWGFPMIAFLFLTHLFMTYRSGFIQRKTVMAIRLSVHKPRGASGDISPFGILCTSLASTLGTGNIIGVGTAVAMGGAGAVFWCWVAGILGMATQYAESLLCVRYRVQTPSGFRGGAMYVLERGVGSRALGVGYASLAAICGLLTGAAIQTNAISEVITEAVESTSSQLSLFGMKIELVPLMVGIVSAVVTALVIFGGIKSIAKVCSLFVPVMAAAYILGCVLILFINRQVLFDTLCKIVSEAFSLRAVAGGGAGSVMMLSMRAGIARGMFSNEAGLGTSAIVSASANTPNPVRQGLCAMTATFWDTVVMCAVTGLVIVSTSVVVPAFSLEGSDGGALCYIAFSRIPYVGEGLLLFAMITFAFSTILGWSCVGESCVSYIFAGKGIRAYLVLWVLAVLFAPLVPLDAVWNMGDLCNALLAVPNVLSLIMLQGEITSLTKQYINDVESSET